MNKQKFFLTVYIGDSEYLHHVVAMNLKSSCLISTHNYDNFINSKLNANTIIHTSVNDLPIEKCFNLLTLADQVFYIPCNNWSDKKEIDFLNPTDSSKGLTEGLLLKLPKDIKVFNLDYELINVNPLVSTRQHEESQLWIAGCSVSHGVGVDSNQRYGSLLADYLQKPASFLTKSGSSISWAADQILRSDIRPDDIVVWGLTNINRLSFIDENNSLTCVNLNTLRENRFLKDKQLEKTILSNHNFFTQLSDIDKVINFCKIIKAKLIIVGLLTSDSCLRYMVKKENFYEFYYGNSFRTLFLDHGSDDIHPGPLQHQSYFNFIKNIISN